MADSFRRTLEALGLNAVSEEHLLDRIGMSKGDFEKMEVPWEGRLLGNPHATALSRIKKQERHHPIPKDRLRDRRDHQART